VVHGDLKPENVMVEVGEQGELSSIKIIDFGNTFSFLKVSHGLQLSTPEYLAPDLLDFLDNKAVLMAQGLDDISGKMLPWSVDMWSLGAIILELVVGFPLWLSLKGRVMKAGGGGQCTTGLFGVAGRLPKKISQRQVQLIRTLGPSLKKMKKDSSIPKVMESDAFMDLLG